MSDQWDQAIKAYGNPPLFPEGVAKVDKPSCCPANSWPGLTTDYAPKGTVTDMKVDDGQTMKVYRVKPEADCAPDVVIYWGYDIGGFTQGRTKAMADTFAELNECEVIMADVYLGDETDWEDIDGFLKKYPTTIVNPRYLKALELAGSRKIIFVGTCWGTLPFMTLCADSYNENYLCGVQYHPSTRACGYEGRDEWELTAKVTVPQFVMAAENDVAEYKPGGKTIEILTQSAPGSQCVEPLPGTTHGWTVRGDVSVPTVKATVENAISQGIAFINQMRSAL